MSSNNEQSTILIIDDEMNFRQSLACYLEDTGYKVLTAENGRSGIETFQREHPDLVLVGLKMPEVDGLEVLSSIKAMSTDTPMIVISGTGKLQDAVEALRRGAWDYLFKPIEDFDIFMNVVDNALENSRLKQENIKYQQSLEKLVTERTLELKMDAIGHVAGGIAHDFNNMIGGIMGAAQLLKSKKRNLDEKSLKFVNMIMQASTRAADLTTKLLAVGRRGKVSSTSIDVHYLINDTNSYLRQSLNDKVSIIIENNAKDHIIAGDSSLLLNAFINICTNADHAMPDGGEITIETKNITLEKAYCNTSPFEIEPGPYIVIEIRDTGSGIPLELFSKIFEPFFTTKKQGQGSGLGLSAVYGTVQDHRGAITVSSKVDKGTVFHIFLPLEDNTPLQNQQESAVVKGSGRILLVDDESLILTVTGTFLEEMGYTVQLARNGREAVEIFQNQHSQIDLIILDMIMPVMSGSEAFIELRKLDNDCRILISSGFFKSEDLEKMKEEGLAGFIRKPYQQSELSQLVAEILNK
ncbi:MAG: response regulator [Deltaproteobacteria bacterium]|nr:response regulator [Deltaproteobacteria bacterium]MBT4265769.1 response regulator [Deltaproteobacteria bacterium]MBT4642021.1 response regulator [Deltaproteobacteria bacterium]MBT6610653.1 response regulator [Deltaproteobacteria bacterium]